MEELAPERPQEPATEAFEQMSEPAAIAADPLTNLSPLGAVVAAQRQLLPFGGSTGGPTYGPMVFGPGSGSRSNQSATVVGANGPGAGSDQAPPPDQGLTSNSDPVSTLGPNPIQGPGPRPDVEPWPDPGQHPGPGQDPWTDPGLRLTEGPGSPLGSTRTPEPTPEPSTMVLTGLGTAGWYLARVRRRACARRTSSGHAFR
jgi:hypothetical protein